MPGTNVFAAKDALFDRLALLTAVGQPLEGVQVSYARPAADEIGLECVYGVGVRFSHEDVTAERPAPIVTEVALVSAYIRVARKEKGAVATTDARAAQILAAIMANLYAQPQLLAGQLSFTGLTQGAGQPEQAPDETLTVLAVAVRIESDLSYG
jgi:hypothetical protein